MAALQALVGHQYGRPSLPTQVEVNEFQVLLQEGRRLGVGTEELERIYWRDENSVPPSYRLRLRPQVQVRKVRQELCRGFSSQSCSQPPLHVLSDQRMRREAKQWRTS